MKSFKKIIVSFLLISISLTSYSCEKLIEVELPNNEILSPNAFQDIQTADAAVAELYAGLRDYPPLAGTITSTGALWGMYTDDLDSYSLIANSAYDLFKNQQTDTNITVQSYWTYAYQHIYKVNSILEGVQSSNGLSQSDRNRLRGECLLIRAILNYYLEQIYGDIPYVTTTNYQVNQVLGKTSEAEVLSKVEADLNEAVSLLLNEYRNAERIYPNQKVAQMMLAKVYMLQNRNAEAEGLLKNIVQSPLYQFENDLTKVFNKSGNHILWQLKPKNSGDPTKEATAYYFTGAAPSSTALSQNLVSVFSSGDLRKSNWIASVTVGSNTWYRANKYKVRSSNTTEYSIVFRIEEVYLMLAETLAKQNKLAETLTYLNPTRQRAGLMPITSGSSQAALLNEIMLENRKEFFTEMGHRFMDLKRLNLLSNLISVKPNWKSYHSRWPIPQQELLLNAHLNPQNTGY